MTKLLRRLFHAHASEIISLVVIAVALGGTWWGLVPFGRRIVALYYQLQKTQTPRERLEDKYATLAQLGETDLLRGSSELLRAIPSDKSVVTLISTLESAANNSGLSVLSLTVTNPGSLATEAAKRQSQEEKKLGAGIIQSGMVVEGTLPGVKQFLATLHQIRRSLRVRLVEVVARGGTGARANLAVDAFWQPLPAGRPDLTATVSPLSPQEEALLVKITSWPVIYQSQSQAEAPPLPLKQNPFAP